jgi:hypothetical protein
LGTLVFDIDPSIMPDWAKDNSYFETLNANLDDFFRKKTATKLILLPFFVL